MASDTVIELTRVSDKGQVVIPKEIRDRFNFAEGTKLIVLATDDAVVLQKVETFVGSAQAREVVERVSRRTTKVRSGHV